MDESRLTDFATRYAAAWSSQNPASLASFYAENGSLTVNAGVPSVGRAAITAAAQAFMTAFPDMVVRLDRVSRDGSHVIFRWIWTGTNTGPGGTGRSVRITGHEEWTIDAEGLIAESKGHYDEAEYERQLNGNRLSAIAKGSFTVEMKPQSEPDAHEGVTLGRMSLDKRFEGDLVATGRGEMLTALTSVKGSAGYVALERVTGTLQGRKGSFVFQHSGTMDRTAQHLSITVVPDSGTGELAGIAGTFRLNIVAGKHFYEFEYSLPR
jgi:steroid delta-isomerase-like uncharacterized protein